MRIRFWGVRGAIASPSPKTLRYGGNTACVAVESEAGALIVLDAGSGFCPLGDELMHGPFGRGKGEMTLLLSHTHMDHLLGFPFATPVHIPGNRFTVYGPAASRKGLEELHEGLVAPAYSPVYTLDNIGSNLDFRSIPRVPFEIGTVHAEARRFPHGIGNYSWGFKLTEDAKSLAYISDVEYRRGAISPEDVAFVKGVDILIHDAHYTQKDYTPDWGHSRIQDAILLAEAAGVARLIFFHHAPQRSDAEIDALVADYRQELHQRGVSLRLDAAYEGMTIQL
jgi:phosphoribosyl 1,2-cyclic phosphodiesterase